MYKNCNIYCLVNITYEFLSFDEFKFVKMWEEWDADMMMMRRGRPFVCVQRTNERMVSCFVVRHARMAAAISFSADE